MATPVIKIKRNNSGSTPTSLVYGELAADVANQKLYIGNSSGSPVLIGDGAFAGGGISQLAFSVASTNGAGNVFQITPIGFQSDATVHFSLDLKTQVANTFFAGPTSDSNAFPTFRGITKDDLAASSAAGYYLKINSTNTGLEWAQITGGTGQPSGSQGEIQIGKSSGFSSKFNFNFDDFILKNIPTTSTVTDSTGPTGATVGNFIVNYISSNLPIGDQYFIFKPNHGLSTGDLVKYSGPAIFGYTNGSHYYISNPTSHTFKLASSRTNAFKHNSLTTSDTTGMDNAPTTPATTIELSRTFVDKYAFNIGSAFSTKYSLLNNNISIGATIIEPSSPGTGAAGTSQVWSGATNTAVHQGIYFNGSRPVPFRAKSNAGGTKLYIQVPSINRTNHNPPPEIAQLTVGDRLATLATNSSLSNVNSSINITISAIGFVAGANSGENIPAYCWIISLTGGTVSGNVEYNCVMFISHRTHRNIIRSKSDNLHPTYFFAPNVKGNNTSIRDYALTSSFRDQGLFIITDNYLRIGFTNRTRDTSESGLNNLDSGDANYASNSVIAETLPHITFEPAFSDSDIAGSSTTNMTGAGRMYFRGVPIVTPTTNDVVFIPIIYAGADANKATSPYNSAYDTNCDNHIRFAKYTWGSASNLTGGGGVDILETQNLVPGPDGSTATKQIKLADEVPINTSLTVPLIKGTSGGDLNITTESPDRDIILSIPQSNTDVVLSAGSIYITAGLDSGDIYMQSVDDVFITSQNVRISGNLIVDGYVESATGFQGDTTDGEESLIGLVMDGGTF